MRFFEIDVSACVDYGRCFHMNYNLKQGGWGLLNGTLFQLIFVSNGFRNRTNAGTLNVFLYYIGRKMKFLRIITGCYIKIIVDNHKFNDREIWDNSKKIGFSANQQLWKERLRMYDLILTTLKRINSILTLVVITMAAIGFSSWLIKGLLFQRWRILTCLSLFFCKNLNLILSTIII